MISLLRVLLKVDVQYYYLKKLERTGPALRISSSLSSVQRSILFESSSRDSIHRAKDPRSHVSPFKQKVCIYHQKHGGPAYDYDESSASPIGSR
jgi:hypothetical protein